MIVYPKSKNGEVLDYSVVTSAYGRRNKNLQNLINKSEIYYINEQKERTDKWLKALGLQLPSAITKYDSINSISKNNKNVKYSLRDTNNYSYDELISKPDMEITYVNDQATYKPTKETRKNLDNDAMKNAVGISSDNNRYYYDDNNLYYHTLLSGYIDGDYFIPIRFGVKENNQGEKTVCYVRTK